MFDAVILAGGLATRLGGGDKPGMIVGGQTLVAVAVAAAADAAVVTVVGPPRPGLRRPPPGGVLRSVRDDPPGCGPLPALRRGMAEVSAPWVAVLAADLPFVCANVVRALLVTAAGGAAGHTTPLGAVLVDEAGEPQWLVGCWLTDTLRAALSAYRGSSLHGLLRPLRPAEVAVPVGAGEPPPWLDCDTTADLRLARGWREGDARSQR